MMIGSKILKHLLLFVIRFYQCAVSPYLGTPCRFTPTCSHYAREALQHHSLPQASQWIMKRIMRCHPWGGAGFDPVPELPVATRLSKEKPL